MRRKGDELNLLTVGNNTYSADARYTVAAEKPDNWQLFIRDAGAHDEGSYECQVSSHPPIVIVVHLFVVGKLTISNIKMFLHANRNELILNTGWSY